MNLISDSKQIKTRQNAFTIIELLIVITIILLLIGLLLPTLGRSRDLARQVKCLSNLQQIYTCISSYSYDHDSFYPTFEDVGGYQYRVAPGLKYPADISRAYPETYGIGAVLDDGGYIDSHSPAWVCDAQTDDQIAFGNTYAYQPDYKFKRTGGLNTKRKDIDKWQAEHDSIAWFLYDNYRFKPYHSGFYKGRGDRYIIIPKGDQRSIHPIAKRGKRIGSEENFFSINMVYKNGKVTLYEFDHRDR